MLRDLKLLYAGCVPHVPISRREKSAWKSANEVAANSKISLLEVSGAKFMNLVRKLGFRKISRYI
jgi:hypothetical protein